MMLSPLCRPGQRLARLLMTGVLALSILTTAGPPSRAMAQDPCAEPNDTFQTACFLGTSSEAVGFLTEADDQDAYRLEALDDGVTAHLELAGGSGAYTIDINDWNGQTIVSSTPTATGAVIDVTLPLPGSYFVFVQSGDGSFSPTVPYRLSLKLAYPYADTMQPQVRFARDFREDAYDGWAKQFSPAPSNQDADFFDLGGRFMIRVNKTGVAQDWPRVASDPFGPDVADSIMTADARICDLDSATGYAGYRIGFRFIDKFHQYSLAVNVEGRRAWLNKVDGSSMKDTVELSEPTRSTYIDNKGGVNRTTIRTRGNDIRISINGGEVIHVTDSTFSHGKFNFVAAAWSNARPLAKFDNVLVTTPSGATSGGPTLPGDPRDRQLKEPAGPCTVS